MRSCAFALHRKRTGIVYPRAETVKQEHERWLWLGLPFAKPSFILFIHSIEAGPLLKDRSLGLFHAETHIPAEPSPPLEDARFSYSYEDQERTGSHLPAPGKGPQASFRKTRVS